MRGAGTVGIFLALSAASAFPLAAQSSSNQLKFRVSSKPVFFNPSLGRSAEIQILDLEGGQVTLDVLDRDRRAVRRIGPLTATNPLVVAWDGKDSGGLVVPDEAYSVRVQHADSRGRRSVYDPSSEHVALIESVEEFSYSRIEGVLNYRLKRTSRVHIQAGQAVPTPKGTREGPILRTVVDRVPRSGGAISERWNGFDQSGKVYVPDLPHFVVAILATSLPESSIITVGNRSLSYAQYRPDEIQGQAPLTAPRAAAAGRAHHQGLSGALDRSPTVKLESLGGSLTQPWPIPATGAIRFRASVPSENAVLFLSPLAMMHVFVDEKEALKSTCDQNPCDLEIPAGAVRHGAHRLVVNWDSGVGPVAVGLAQLENK